MKTLTNDTLSFLVTTFVSETAAIYQVATISQFHGQFVATFGRKPEGEGPQRVRLPV